MRFTSSPGTKAFVLASIVLAGITIADINTENDAYTTYAQLDARAQEFEVGSLDPGLEVRAEVDADGSAWNINDAIHVREDFGMEDHDSAHGMLVPRRGGRGGGGILDLIQLGISAVNQVLEGDKELRSKYTYSLIGILRAKDPSFNYVVCHTKHRTRFDGKKKKDWDHRHEEVDVKFGGTIGFEIYSFRSGEFWREGDGGFLNWAYGGNVKSKSGDGKHLVFARP